MPARLHKQTVDENWYDGEDHDSKDAGVITRPSEGGNQKWEWRLTVLTPLRRALRYCSVFPAWRVLPEFTRIVSEGI